MEQLISRIVRAPWSHKIGVVAGIAVLATAITWFVFVDPTEDKIASVEARRKSLEGDFIDKQQIANNLNEYRKQKELLEEQLEAALLELPDDKAIDELIRNLNELGISSGLQITSIEPMAEVPQEFFARLPVKMKVSGTFHEVALFYDAVGKLKRIVNISDLKFGDARNLSEKMIVNAEFVATTFRFREPGPGDDKPARGRRGR